jgi:Tol biopolymer transport system component
MERNAQAVRSAASRGDERAGRDGSWRRGLAVCLAFGALLLGACVSAASRASVPLVVAAPLAQLASPLPPGRIVFVANGDLWEWTEGTVRQLTSGERYEGPAWSPDGELLAASLVGVNHSDLVLLSPEGELLQRLTDNRGRRRIQESDWARMPAWAPDGSRIAFASDIRTYDLALWSIGLDGRNPRQLFVPPDYHGGVDRPTWSPSGDEIALAVWRDGRGQIEILTPATGRTRRLTDAANGAYDPAWSPTGHWIAYVARDGARHDIWLVRPEGGAPVRLTTSGRNRMPAWSPDGAWLAFLSLSENGFDVRVIPVAAEAAEIEPGEGRVLVSAYPVEGPAGLTWGP